MKTPSAKTIGFVLASALLAVTLVTTQHLVNANTKKGMPPPPAKQSDPQVSVVWQEAASYTGHVVAYGATKAHFEVDLTTQVSGKIEKVSPLFENGQRLKKGAWLAKLDKSNYIAAVATAEQTLADATVNLLEEERQAQQAITEWQSSGLSGEPDSDLVLRKPQIKAAKSLVASAKASLNSAKKDLAYTAITAPFDALVINRKVSPGSFVQAGSEIASLYSTDWVEVEAALSTKDWQNLPDQKQLNSGQWPAKLVSVEDGQSWDGVVLRTGQHLDGETRQRSVIVAVKHPFEQKSTLHPGTFVKVIIDGKQVEHLWEVPHSALSQRGEIWYVKEDNTLDKFSTTPQFSSDGMIYIQALERFIGQKIAILSHPLNSYLKGMKVQAVEVVNE